MAQEKFGHPSATRGEKAPQEFWKAG